MEEVKYITSKSNPLIKYYLELQKKNTFRKKENKFVIEGKRELIIALKSEYEFDKILFNPNIILESEITDLLKKYNCNSEIISLGEEAYTKLAYREKTEGILAIAKKRDLSLKNLKLPKNPLILIGEQIEKPGNIGAMLRTCDATSVDAFILASPLADIYNPNIIRASVGTIFSVPIAIAESEEVITFLNENDIPLYAATLQDSETFYNINFKNSAAIAVGNEAKGLSKIIRQNATKNILIPMMGKIDSLNVSVSAAFFLSEAMRQRFVE